MRVRAWWCMATVAALGCGATPTHALTLGGYFKVLELAARKRDVWRKIFLGRDIGFAVSPWLFKDRVQPPFVPIVTTFPRYPIHGHYRHELVLPPPPIASSRLYSPLLPASAIPRLSHLGHFASSSMTHRRKGKWLAAPLYIPICCPASANMPDGG